MQKIIAFPQLKTYHTKWFLDSCQTPIYLSWFCKQILPNLVNFWQKLEFTLSNLGCYEYKSLGLSWNCTHWHFGANNYLHFVHWQCSVSFFNLIESHLHIQGHGPDFWNGAEDRLKIIKSVRTLLQLSWKFLFQQKQNVVLNTIVMFQSWVFLYYEDLVLNKNKKWYRKFISQAEKILFCRHVEETTQWNDPGFSGLLHRIRKRLQIQVHNMLIFKQAFQLDLLVYSWEELQLFIVHDTRWISCCKSLINNSFAFFPKRPIAFPVAKVAISRVEKSLNILGHSHGALIDLRVVPNITAEVEGYWFLLTANLLRWTFDTRPTHPTQKLLRKIRHLNCIICSRNRITK